METNKLVFISIGETIRKILKKKGIKQCHFAKLMGIKKSNASTLLNRKDWYVSKVIRASQILETNLFESILPVKGIQQNYVMEDEPMYLIANATEKLKQCREQCRELMKDKEVMRENIELLKLKIQNL